MKKKYETPTLRTIRIGVSAVISTSDPNELRLSSASGSWLDSEDEVL